jgi:hypothetical protein
MSMNVNVEEVWMPEPELMEPTPRRMVPFEDYPDRNRPNVPLFGGISAFLVVLGFALISFAVSKRGGNIPAGAVSLGLGFVGMVFFPYRLRTHLQRATQLVEYGNPVMARLLSADNLSGDTYTRSVKYQVTIPGGELTHKQINVDDRVLPKRIPSNVTALMDMQSGDVELYCALPFRAVRKVQPAPVAAPVESRTTTTQAATPAAPQAMETIATTPVPEIKREKPKEDTKKTTETYE